MQQVIDYCVLHWLDLIVFAAALGSLAALIQFLLDQHGFTWGVLSRWHSLWIGAHWSSYNRRLCVNVIPFVTVWITAPKGIAPERGKDLYRSDGKAIRIKNVVDHRIIDDYIKRDE